MNLLSLAFLMMSVCQISLGEDQAPLRVTVVTEWEARVTPGYGPKESILGFSLSESVVPVRLERKDNETFLWARIRGELKRPGWNLLYQNQWLVRAGGDRDFEIEVRLMDQTTPIVLSAFDSHGRIGEQHLDVEFPSWVNYQAQIAEERRLKREEEIRLEREAAEQVKNEAIRVKRELMQAESLQKRVAGMKRFAFTPMLGYSFLSYAESFEASVDMMALTPQVSIQGVLLPPWLSLQLSGFITAFALSNTRSDVSLRFAGLDLTLGMALPFGQSGLRFNLLLGGYFKTMFVSPATLGYQNMLGPEIFPILDYQLPAGHSIHLFGKLSPTLGAVGGFLPFTNREIVVGGGYTHALANGHQVPIQIEYSWIDLNLSSKNLAGRTLQVSAGYSF